MLVGYLLDYDHSVNTELYKILVDGDYLRDRPFNLKGGEGLWFFVSFRNFFSDNTRVRIYFFCRAKREFFFPIFYIRLYDKNSESDYFFFLHQNQNIFFSNIGNQNIFLVKNHNPPLQVKWSFPNPLYINVLIVLC
jgi:hypothetical protein